MDVTTFCCSVHHVWLTKAENVTDRVNYRTLSLACHSWDILDAFSTGWWRSSQRHLVDTPRAKSWNSVGPQRRRAPFERVVASSAPPWPRARPSKRSHALCAWRMVETRPSATLGAAEDTSRVDPGVHRGDAAALLEGAAPPARHMVMRCACRRVRQQSLADVPSVTTVAETPVSVHRARDTLPRAREACEHGEASGL